MSNGDMMINRFFSCFETDVIALSYHLANGLKM